MSHEFKVVLLVTSYLFAGAFWAGFLNEPFNDDPFDLLMFMLLWPFITFGILAYRLGKETVKWLER